MLQGQRYTAINLLEKAIKLDPKSYELRYWLGQANAGPSMPYDPAINAFESAAAIDPNHVTLQSELGRLYLAKGEVAKAIEHLRLALQTDGYDDDDSAAAVTDFYLAKALQQAGYDRAALDSYVRLIGRLQNGGLVTRGSPELSYLVAQPEGLFVQVGELCEKRGMLDDAIRLYKLAVDRKGEDFSYQSHLVRALASAGKHDEATAAATDVVRQFRASPESLALLKDVFKKFGGDDAVARELERLHREQPTDRTILYALVDVLNTSGHRDRAIALLTDAAKRQRYDTELVRRLFKLYDAAGDVDAGARLVIDALAARPDATRDFVPLWSELLRPWRKNHVTVDRLQSLSVPPQAQASKSFWLAELARIWGREQLARAALEHAVKQVPPFAPAHRVLIGQYWQRQDWDEAQKTKASQDLIASVERSGDPALAAELRGLLALAKKDPSDAIRQLNRAQELGDTSADLRLAQATALQATGEGDRAAAALWKLIQDQPTCDDAYLQLFRRYIDEQQFSDAIKVMQTWVANDPNNANAKILQSSVFLQAHQEAAAEQILNDLFEREPDNGDVLAALSAFYGQTGKIDQFIAKLEAQRTAHPENRTAIEQLVLIYAAQKRAADAARVLDETRKAVVNDPDLLYYLASLYTRIGQKETTEQILEQIVQNDPQHAPACNDLGYSWAEQGKNLVRAESLIRTAVAKEPDNHAYLDSLGWVLYKRGRFDQAKTALEQSIGNASLPDPTVLDHLGDTLYRLDRKTDAQKEWEQAANRLGVGATTQPADAAAPADDATAAAAAGDDTQQLRLQLRKKLKQLEADQPVSVSPVAAGDSAAAPPKQANTKEK